jgi:zinc protease
MSRRVLLSLACAASLTAALPAGAQLEQPPAPGPLRPFALPTPQEFRLSNGLRVVVVEDHGLPVVHGRILVNAGSLFEPAEKNGLAALTAQLLREGTRSMTGPQIAERMEQLGAQFSTSAAYTVSTAQVTALKSAFPEALALAATTVSEPAFAETELTRVRNQMVAGYQQSISTVEGLAVNAFNRAVYDEASGWSRPVGGTRATLTGLTRDDVIAYHSRMYGPANATLLLVGDVTPAEARTIAQRAVGSWAGSAAAAAFPRPTARTAPATRVILVDRPGSVQSGIYVGQSVPGAEDPELIPLQALTHVLGGGFRARVNMLLREAKGWTYGAFASLSPGPGAGDFAVSSSVRTNATDSAVAAVVQQYQRIVAEPVPAGELTGSIANLVGSFPSSVQTAQGLANRIQTVLVNRYPLDYYSNYRERLAAVRPADIARVGAARLTPNAVTVVVAGDLATIEAPIRALNLGPVEVWDAEGRKVR